MDDDRGDVADWGRTGEQSPVDLSANGEDDKSMSSGMSPRDREWSPEGRGGPRARVFGPAEGLASLVHHTKTYMASQQLRKCACSSQVTTTRPASLKTVWKWT
jgi:hypothetical protein